MDAHPNWFPAGRNTPSRSAGTDPNEISIGTSTPLIPTDAATHHTSIPAEHVVSRAKDILKEAKKILDSRSIDDTFSVKEIIKTVNRIVEILSVRAH
jgi:hypothetical protein